MKNVIVILSLILVISAGVYAHEGEKHMQMMNVSAKLNNQINEDYEKNVKPIFVQKCFNCHGATTNYPWYYKIPGAKGVIDDDIAEAKKHLDFSDGFPFKSHSSPKEDLEAIVKSVEEGEMPPLRYRILHWNSRLTTEELQIVREWTKRSLSILGSQPN